MMSLTNGSHLTMTEKRMLSVLSDGLPHHLMELYQLLWDDQSDSSAVSVHICRLRKKLTSDYTILCEFYKRSYRHYRLVRLVGQAKKDKGLQAIG